MRALRDAANESANTSVKVLFASAPRREKREVSAIVLLLRGTFGGFFEDLPLNYLSSQSLPLGPRASLHVCATARHVHSQCTG